MHMLVIYFHIYVGVLTAYFLYYCDLYLMLDSGVIYIRNIY